MYVYLFMYDSHQISPVKQNENCNFLKDFNIHKQDVLYEVCIF